MSDRNRFHEAKITPVDLEIGQNGQPTHLRVRIDATSEEAEVAAAEVFGHIIGAKPEPINGRKVFSGLGDRHAEIDWTKKPKGDVRNN